MQFVLACLPIAVVLALMLGPRWGAHKAGAAGLAAAAVASAAFFGLTPEILWISQVKGFLLSFYVLAVMWPALFLFHWLNTVGGVEAAAGAIKELIPDRGMCAVLVAWCLSGVFEGVAGFGLPVAIVSPMLVSLGIPPLRAVAAVAIGHSWAVTFGSMGLIVATLINITGLEQATVSHWAGILLGVGCVGCGLCTAAVLQEQRRWPIVLIIGCVVAGTQYGLAVSGLTVLGSFGGGAAGLAAYIIGRKFAMNSARGTQIPKVQPHVGLRPAVGCYGALTLIMAGLAFWPDLRQAAEAISWKASFSSVETRTGFVTPAGSGPAFKPFTHPGALVGMVSMAAVAAAYSVNRKGAHDRLKVAAEATLQSGGLATLGVLFMVGISAVMDHCGMTLTLAKGLTNAAGAAYPLFAPVVGVLGAFATGSNNNSNIMFATLQKNAALILQVSPALILAGQTAGGSLGSMIAPAKLVIGCSTTGLTGQEGRVLRRTAGPLVVITMVVGSVLLVLALLGAR